MPNAFPTRAYSAPCLYHPNAAAQVLSIGEVMAAFVIMGFSMVLSLICLIVEAVYHILKAKKFKKPYSGRSTRRRVLMDSDV